MINYASVHFICVVTYFETMVALKLAVNEDICHVRMRGDNGRASVQELCSVGEENHAQLFVSNLSDRFVCKGARNSFSKAHVSVISVNVSNGVVFYFIYSFMAIFKHVHS